MAAAEVLWPGQKQVSETLLSHVESGLEYVCVHACVQVACLCRMCVAYMCECVCECVCMCVCAFDVKYSVYINTPTSMDVDLVKCSF